MKHTCIDTPLFYPGLLTGVAVPGYVLAIGSSSVANWNRCGNYNGGQCLDCVILLDNVSYTAMSWLYILVPVYHRMTSLIVCCYFVHMQTTFHYRHELYNLKYTKYWSPRYIKVWRFEHWVCMCCCMLYVYLHCCTRMIIKPRRFSETVLSVITMTCTHRKLFLLLQGQVRRLKRNGRSSRNACNAAVVRWHSNM